MIKNERQLKITRSQREKFKSDIDTFDLEAKLKSGIDPIIAQAMLDQLESECEILTEQIEEYEKLSSGAETDIVVNSLQELPHALIKARIARGWIQEDLAKALSLKVQQIQRYEADDYNTANLATLLRVAEALELDLTKIVVLSIKPDEPANFPVDEMYKRGWFEDFSGTLYQAKKKSDVLIENFFIKSGYAPNQLVRHKKRARLGSSIDEYALIAWQARVIGLTEYQTLSTEFNQDTLTPEWFRELTMLSQYGNGPILARKKLLDSGIYFVIETHLNKTHLDGAAIRHPSGSPVVALTVRHDRLDNFWFLLFHELAHIHLHFDNDEDTDFFDNIEIDSDDIEAEADEFALNMLLPPEFWENCMSRYSLDVDTVREEARQFHIHPSIIAGRIRHELRDENGYTLLNDAVGHTEVSNIFQIQKQ